MTVMEALGGPAPEQPETKRVPLIIIVGADKGGVGKEQPLTAKILTPSGWKTMAEMKIGLPICGADGKTYQVSGIFPQGIKPAYRVSFTDGTSAECGLEHLWTVKNVFNGKRDGWRTKTTAELLSLDHSKYTLPIIEAVQFASQSVPVEPYLLGVLIGDGYLVGSSCAFSVPPTKEPIRQKIMAALPETYSLTGPHGPDASPQWRITGGEKGKSTMLAAIRKLDLDRYSKERFIPEIYKTASISDRIELLRGLMDTDGSAQNGRTSFSSCSERLADDLADLVRSLGGIAIKHRYDRSKQGKPVEFDVNVRMRICPFSLDYKAAHWRPASNARGKYIKAIDPIGEVPQQCISTTAPDQLYITDGYSATHNTMIARALMDYIAQKGVSVRAFDTEPDGAGVLKRFFPRAEMLNATSLPGQMTMIDSADAGTVTLVDGRAGLLAPMLKAFHRIDLLEDVRKGNLNLLVLHVVGSSVASASEIKPVMEQLKGASLIRVNNRITTEALFAPDEHGEVAMDIPNLEETAAAAVDKAGQPFSTFCNDPASRIVLRGYVRAWLRDVHEAFDGAGIGSMLG